MLAAPEGSGSEAVDYWGFPMFSVATAMASELRIWFDSASTQDCLLHAEATCPSFAGCTLLLFSSSPWTLESHSIVYIVRRVCKCIDRRLRGSSLPTAQLLGLAFHIQCHKTATSNCLLAAAVQRTNQIDPWRRQKDNDNDTILIQIHQLMLITLQYSNCINIPVHNCTFYI